MSLKEQGIELRDLDPAEMRSVSGDFGAGLTFMAGSYGSDHRVSYSADVSDFAKWLRVSRPDVRIELPQTTARTIQRSGEICLPLVLLGSDVAIQVYLNIVGNYLYDLGRGSFGGRKRQVSLSVVFDDKALKRRRKLEYSGDAETLLRLAERFDLDGFRRE